MSGLVVTDRRTFDQGQTLHVEFQDGARARFYEDPHTGTPADYGVHPPNATAPSTFVDGRLVLDGEVDDFILFYEFWADQGGFNANHVDYTGSLIDDAQLPIDGWELGGLLSRPASGRPPGYVDAAPGQTLLIVDPATRSSWGAIKKTYR